MHAALAISEGCACARVCALRMALWCSPRYEVCQSLHVHGHGHGHVHVTCILLSALGLAVGWISVRDKFFRTQPDTIGQYHVCPCPVMSSSGSDTPDSSRQIGQPHVSRHIQFPGHIFKRRHLSLIVRAPLLCACPPHEPCAPLHPNVVVRVRSLLRYLLPAVVAVAALLSLSPACPLSLVSSIFSLPVLWLLHSPPFTLLSRNCWWGGCLCVR